MIDWLNLFLNSLFIVGLVMIIVSFNYSSQRSVQSDTIITKQSRSNILDMGIDIDAVLIGAGLIIIADTLLEVMIWFVLMVGFLYQIVKKTLSHAH